MIHLDEETALSILFANTRRKKRSVDLVTLAQACQYLVKLYGSQKAVADRLGLSTEMIREFLMTLKLPEQIQRLTADRRIDRLDIVRELASLPDEDSQLEAAQTIVSCSSKDMRDIKRLVKHGGLAVSEAKKAVSEAKPKGFHIFLIDLDDETYKALLRLAKDGEEKPAELAKRIINAWVSERVDGDPGAKD